MNIFAPHSYVRKLDRALDRMGGLYLARDLLSAVRAGKMQMFAEGDSIAVTQIALYPRAKALEIIVAVGELEELRILHDRLMVFATEMGVSVIQACGRKGWFADAAKRGWKIKAQAFVYQKDM